MTAKDELQSARQELLELIEKFSGTEVYFWLAKMKQEPTAAMGGVRTSLFDEIRAIWAEIPDEELARMPSSADIDRVVYGNPHGLQ